VVFSLLVWSGSCNAVVLGGDEFAGGGFAGCGELGHGSFGEVAAVAGLPFVVGFDEDRAGEA
jgi:hypothetical protein